MNTQDDMNAKGAVNIDDDMSAEDADGARGEQDRDKDAEEEE